MNAVRASGRDPAARPRAAAISTQAELAEALREAGHDVVQTTVSRDIAQLGLVRCATRTGRLVYALPGAADLDRLRELAAALRRWALAVDAGGNIVVVRRRPATRARSPTRSTTPATRTSPGRSPARTRSSSSPAKASPAPSCATSSAHLWKEPHERTAVLAYSGGLDTSCAIAWLKEDYGFDEVVAVLVDVGQDVDLSTALARGRAAGADDVIVLDQREAFADDQVAKALKTNALYEGRYPLVSALSRPVIAEAVAEIALELGAEAVVHGCTGKGNDQLRFELAFKASYPGVRVIAPLRDQSGRARRRSSTRSRAGSRSRRRGVAVLDRRQPVRPRDRGRGPRGPVAAPPEDAFVLTAHRRRRARARRGRDRVRARPAGRARRRGAAARRARRRAERAGRRLRDRADRHDREPRRRDQEPGAVRGAGRAHADRGAPRAGGARADEGRAAGEARARAALGEARLRRPLVHPAARGDRRLLRRHAGARDRRGAARCARARRVVGRRSRARALRGRLASYGAGETFPHEAAEGFIRIAALETELAAAREREVATA